MPALGVTALLVFVLVRHMAGTDAVLEAVRNARWVWLGAAALLLAVGLLFSALRWSVVLRAMGHVVPLRRIVGAILGTWPLALVVPARASDLLRGLAIADLVPAFEGTGSVLAEKAVDLQSLCLIACVGALASGLPVLAGLAAAAFALAWLGIFAVVRWRGRVARLPLLRRRQARVEQLLLGIHALSRHPRWLLAACALSLGAWSMSLGLAQVMFAMTDAGVDPRTTLALFPLAVLTSTLPVTIAGMGTRDAAFIYLLRATGSGGDEPAVLVATIAYAIVGTWSLAVLGVPFMIALVLSYRRARADAGLA